MTPKMPSYFLAAGFSGEVVTANRVIFAVVRFCRSPRMAFQPPFSGVVSLAPWRRSWRSIPSRRSFSCQGKKRSQYIKTSPSRIFRSAEASLMYRLCISQTPKGMCLCVIQLAHLHGSIVYHIELMFVNMIFIIATGKEYKS